MSGGDLKRAVGSGERGRSEDLQEGDLEWGMGCWAQSTLGFDGLWDSGKRARLEGELWRNKTRKVCLGPTGW